MKMNSIGIVALVSLLSSVGVSACSKEKAQEAPSEAKPPAPVAKPETKPAIRPPSPEKEPAAVADPGSVKVIMAGLGADMAAVQQGLWAEDFDLIAKSAMKVADHPKISDAEKGRLKAALTTDMPAFGAMDKAVHEGAVKLSEAAASKDMEKTLTELASLQTNCVACHSKFRKRLAAPAEPAAPAAP